MIQTIILSAGKSKRMKSKIPKPLIRVAGLPMISRIVKSATAGAPRTKPIVVIDKGPRGKAIRALLGRSARYAIQRRQKGTAHAVQSARTIAGSAGIILVISADHPFLSPQAITSLIQNMRKTRATTRCAGCMSPELSQAFPSTSR